MINAVCSHGVTEIDEITVNITVIRSIDQLDCGDIYARCVGWQTNWKRITAAAFLGDRFASVMVVANNRIQLED